MRRLLSFLSAHTLHKIKTFVLMKNYTSFNSVKPANISKSNYEKDVIQSRTTFKIHSF